MARIRHFDHDHSTVAEVRSCPGRNSARIPTTAPEEPTCVGSAGPFDPRPEFVTDPATPAQVRYIKGLTKDRVTTGLDANALETVLDVDGGKQISFREARHALDALEKAPHNSVARAANEDKGPGGYPVFEDGFHALRDEEGTVHFYSLQHEDESRGSRYAGWPVLRAQASDDLHLIRKREVKFDVINRVNEDPKAARLLYADELGQCYVCGRTLTDETSRRLGIGPVCRGKHPALVYEREGV